MKQRVSIILFTLILSVYNLSAQNEFFVGPSAGLNVTKLYGNNASNFGKSDFSYGWYVGPKIHVNFKKINMGFDVAIEYSQSRINRQYSASPTNPFKDVVDHNRSDNYQTISIPINYRYTYNILNDKLDAFAFTGPQFDFNVGKCNFVDENGIYKINRVHYSWNVGAGVAVLKNIQVSAQYSVSLNPIASFQGDHTINNYKCNPRVTSFRVGIAYLFGKKMKKRNSDDDYIGVSKGDDLDNFKYDPNDK